MGLRKQEPWELWREVVGCLGDRRFPCVADCLEMEIIGVDCDFFRDYFD
jgi:hypothetical protein